MHKDIFISHTWRSDCSGRNNHNRCKILCDKLNKCGYSTWFDHYDMGRDVNNSIITAIDNCKVFIVCLTNAYCLKINDAVKMNKINDNCFKEWNYAVYRNKTIIPVIMEESMLKSYTLKEGIINMYLNSLIYFDITDDDYENNDFLLLCKSLRKQGIYTNTERDLLIIRDTLSFNSFLEYIGENFNKPKAIKIKSFLKTKSKNIIYI